MRKWDKCVERVNILSKEKQVSWNLHICLSVAEEQELHKIISFPNLN